jgi:hypothetical protein
MTDKLDGKRRKSFGRWLTILLVAGACWFVIRSCEYGIPNVFFRDHHHTDDRELTEDVAVDLTRKALAVEGIDVASLKPQPFWRKDPRVFARTTINSNSGYVLWGDPRQASGWEYSVTIEKNGSDVRCRVYRPK